MSAAVGQKRNLFVVGTACGSEDLSSLSRHNEFRRARSRWANRRPRNFQMSVCSFIRLTKIEPLLEMSGLIYDVSPDVTRRTLPSRNVTWHRPNVGK